MNEEVERTGLLGFLNKPPDLKNITILVICNVFLPIIGNKVGPHQRNKREFLGEKVGS